MKKITALIPARGGSVGIPRKNISIVNGHPLIAYSIIACKLVKDIGRVIVSTEDEEIAEISRLYGAEVPFMRPSKYASNMSRDIEYLRHFFDLIPEEEIALLRPTTPLRDPSVMSSAIATYYENKQNISSLRSVNRIDHTPYKMFKIENNICDGYFHDFEGIKNYTNLPRQMFPLCYEGNGHIDIVKKTTVESGDSFGNKIYGYVVEKITDIDVRFDLEILKLQINTRKDLLSKHLK